MTGPMHETHEIGVLMSAPTLPAAGSPSPAGAGAAPEDLRRLFRRHAAAVAVVTATDDGGPVGLLVTSLVSVSTAPPLLSFNVSRGSSSWPALERADHIAVHVLNDDQADLADRFARKGAPRFDPPTRWREGPHGLPLIDGTAATSIAQVTDRISAGDHVIVLARLLHIHAEEGTHPLVHHDGSYHRAVPLAG
jgi:flavin reductase (DIM6/NTAB) family NADH-FMN oxidoreductase RutF